MWFLALACAFFLGIHLLTGGLKLKEQIIDGVGHAAYLALFSLSSVIGLVWMIFAFAVAKQDPMNIRFWQAHVFLHYVAILPMIIAFILVVAGMLSETPTNLASLSRVYEKPVLGIVRISRHPVLAGIGLWALIHLILAGNLAAWLFFGTLLVLCVLGANSIDRKRTLLWGDTYRSIMRRTSIIPFNAIMEGRTVFLPKEIGVLRPLLAFSMFCVFLVLHEMLFAARVF
jgi:uncharacterized membrane protein